MNLTVRMTPDEACRHESTHRVDYFEFRPDVGLKKVTSWHCDNIACPMRFMSQTSFVTILEAIAKVNRGDYWQDDDE